MTKTMYLLNAFSAQMITIPCNVKFTEVDQLPQGLTSAIGHQDTANVLGVPMNRTNVHHDKGDTAYIAQLVGGRLPEGSTTLPNGFAFNRLRYESKRSIETIGTRPHQYGVHNLHVSRRR